MKSNANEQVLFALRDVVSTTLKCWLDENKSELLHVFREVIGENAFSKKQAEKPASKSAVQFLDTAAGGSTPKR